MSEEKGAFRLWGSTVHALKRSAKHIKMQACTLGFTLNLHPPLGVLSLPSAKGSLLSFDTSQYPTQSLRQLIHSLAHQLTTYESNLN